jgi:hypothetical protein
MLRQRSLSEKLKINWCRLTIGTDQKEFDGKRGYIPRQDWHRTSDNATTNVSVFQLR